MEPATGLGIGERPYWLMPPSQNSSRLSTVLGTAEAVQLCRVLRFRGAYPYYAAAETQDEQIGAAAITKYRMTTGTSNNATCPPQALI